jgi:O-antigen/teichoic acid export membrane protein
MNNSKTTRIVKNTVVLYIRQILILFVNLYTVRVLLDILGIEDFGVYNVIGGIVTFFTFLSGTMASATQRFFSYAIGEKNYDKQKKTFTATWIIYLAIAIIALILLETVGLWFIQNQLQIPEEKTRSIQYLYQFSIYSFIATIISTPFISIIIAHEDMHIYAYLSGTETLIKLCAIILLSYHTGNKLEGYGILVFITSVITTTLYLIVAVRKYKECQFRTLFIDKKLLKEILTFTSWTLFGQMSNVARNQATTILINQFHNPIAVAGRAIATSVTNQINVFSNNFNTSLYPPIIKSYATNNKEEMTTLVNAGSKITFFLMWIFALPIFVEMDFILKIWLTTPPTDAAHYTRLSLIEVLITALALPLTTAARAPGKMKTYELTIGSIQFCTFICSWLAIKHTGLVTSVFIVAIVANLIISIVRLYLLQQILNFNVRTYIIDVINPITKIFLVSTGVTYSLKYSLSETLPNIGLLVIASTIINLICMYFYGMNDQMRSNVINYIKNKIK